MSLEGLKGFSLMIEHYITYFCRYKKTVVSINFFKIKRVWLRYQPELGLLLVASL